MKKVYFFIFLTLFFHHLTKGQSNTQVMYSGELKNPGYTWELLSKGIHHFDLQVMPIYGELFITSSMPDSANHNKPTLSDACLLPLYNQYKRVGEHETAASQMTSCLLIRAAFEPEKVEQLVRKALRNMQEMVSYKSNDEWHQGQVLLLSADDNLKKRIDQERTIVSLPIGTLQDSTSNLAPELMPVIEVPFSQLTNWKGTGNISFEEYLAVKSLVNRIHTQGRKICVTGCPNQTDAWDVLIKAEIDLISTPDAFVLKDYLDNQQF